MKKIILSTLVTCMVSSVFSQNVGISEASPNSKLDVVQTETTGNSIEISHSITTNTSAALRIKNSGLGNSLTATNLSLTSTAPVAFFDQGGLGEGIYTLMPAGNSSAGILAVGWGSGDGVQILQGGTGWGIYNGVTSGVGQFNQLLSYNFSVFHDLTDAGGIGSYVDLDVQDGWGVVVSGTNPGYTSGGDVIGISAFVRTVTPTIGTVVSGAALAGEQYGLGHGILINHFGASGRNAEFNIDNASNTDPAIFASHTGQGSAIVGQNQSNAITGAISVADFSYTGSDIDDHIAVSGSSVPSAGWGIGVMGVGGWYGVYSDGDLFAQGDLTASGVKPFTIDHPNDPENKILKHFSIESNEVLNMYRGTVVLDGNGKAIVSLPDYFEAINKDFSYQLTAIGTPVHPYVYSEIEGNTFEVAGEPNTKVSWTVYADRNDPYLQQNPERGNDVVEKQGDRKGKYFSPELYNQPESKGMFYNENNTNTSPSKFDPAKKRLSQDKLDNIKRKGRDIKLDRPDIKE